MSRAASSTLSNIEQLKAFEMAAELERKQKEFANSLRENLSADVYRLIVFSIDEIIELKLEQRIGKKLSDQKSSFDLELKKFR